MSVFTYVDNFPPNITAEDTFNVKVGHMNIFNFTVQDTDNNIIVDVIGEISPTELTIVSNGGSQYSLLYHPTAVSNDTLTLIAADPHNASATFSPSLHFCACSNGEKCTLEGLVLSDAQTLTMNCACSEGIIHIYNITLNYMYLTIIYMVNFQSKLKNYYSNSCNYCVKCPSLSYTSFSHCHSIFRQVL